MNSIKPKIVVGNWKMNTTFEEAEELMDGIFENLNEVELSTEVVLAPPFVYLELLSDYVDADGGNFSAGAQNCAPCNNGASLAKYQQPCWPILMCRFAS